MEQRFYLKFVVFLGDLPVVLSWDIGQSWNLIYDLSKVILPSWAKFAAYWSSRLVIHKEQTDRKIFTFMY